MIVTNSAPVPPASAAPAFADIRDIKPPVFIPNPWEWVWWVIAALAVLTAVLLLWMWWRWRKNNVPVVPPVPAHIRARQKLRQALSLLTQPKPFCTAVSDASRAYLEERFRFRAPERTTEEFLRELAATNLLTAEQKGSLGRFLGSCDMVKFAKYEPGETELRELYGSAMHLIDETADMEIPLPVEDAQAGTQKGAGTPPPLPGAARGRIFAVVGALLQLGPAIWVVMVMVTMSRVVIAAQGLPGGTDSDEFRPMVLTAFRNLYGFLGWMLLMVGLAGLGMMAMALTSLRYRAKWFFWFVMVYGVLVLWLIPFGTAVGIIFLVLAWKHRGEFSRPTPRGLKK